MRDGFIHSLSLIYRNGCNTTGSGLIRAIRIDCFGRNWITGPIWISWFPVVVPTRRLSSPIEQIGRLTQEFDLIISTGVLHHLACPEWVLRHLRKV